MSTVHRDFAGVQIVGLPETLPGGPEPFHPSDVELARDLGREMARISGDSEPPPGMDDAERAAYREGFAAQVAEEALIDSLEDEQLAEHFRVDLSDADLWPAVGSYT